MKTINVFFIKIVKNYTQNGTEAFIMIEDSFWKNIKNFKIEILDDLVASLDRDIKKCLLNIKSSIDSFNFRSSKRIVFLVPFDEDHEEFIFNKFSLDDFECDLNDIVSYAGFPNSIIRSKKCNPVNEFLENPSKKFKIFHLPIGNLSLSSDLLKEENSIPLETIAVSLFRV